MDSLDLAVFPAVATQSGGGLNVEQTMDLVRILAIQNEVGAAEFKANVPFYLAPEALNHGLDD